jgi:hypothetical protein
MERVVAWGRWMTCGKERGPRPTRACHQRIVNLRRMDRISRLVVSLKAIEDVSKLGCVAHAQARYIIHGVNDGAHNSLVETVVIHWV